MKIKMIFRWYDFYIGLYYDRYDYSLYIFFIPMVGIKIHNKVKKTKKQNEYDFIKHEKWKKQRDEDYFDNNYY